MPRRARPVAPGGRTSRPRVGSRRPAVAALIGAGLLGGLLTGCSSGDDAALPAPTPSAPPSVSAPAPSPTPTPTPAAVNPFSGKGPTGRPVLVVKLDNTINAQPHAGLVDADLVYIEEVEWGLTRIAAVFSGTLPKVVGPVRSARISDLELMRQFGKPAFAFSGSQRKMHPLIAQAHLFALSPDYDSAGFYRVGDRREPYNEMASPKTLLDQAPKASAARDIGLRFSTDAPAGGRAVTSVTATYPDASVEYVWDAKSGRWDVRMNGRAAAAAEGGTQHAATAVIQYVRQSDSGFGDKYGGRTPLLRTTGTGKALVLRDGRAYRVTWSRPKASGGTTFTLPDGQVMTFAPGQTWITLLNKKTPAKTK